MQHFYVPFFLILSNTTAPKTQTIPIMPNTSGNSLNTIAPTIVAVTGSTDAMIDALLGRMYVRPIVYTVYGISVTTADISASAPMNTGRDVLEAASAISAGFSKNKAPTVAKRNVYVVIVIGPYPRFMEI